MVDDADDAVNVLHDALDHYRRGLGPDAVEQLGERRLAAVYFLLRNDQIRTERRLASSKAYSFIP